MIDIIVSMLTGGVGAAIIGGIMGFVSYKIKRYDERRDIANGRISAKTTAIRYIMLYIIREECEKHIARGRISYEDRRMLHKWHDLYHKNLGGNGDADLLLKQVDALPLITEGDIYGT